MSAPSPSLTSGLRTAADQAPIPLEHVDVSASVVRSRVHRHRPAAVSQRRTRAPRGRVRLPAGRGRGRVRLRSQRRRHAVHRPGEGTRGSVQGLRRRARGGPRRVPPGRRTRGRVHGEPRQPRARQPRRVDRDLRDRTPVRGQGAPLHAPDHRVTALRAGRAPVGRGADRRRGTEPASRPARPVSLRLRDARCRGGPDHAHRIAVAPGHRGPRGHDGPGDALATRGRDGPRSGHPDRGRRAWNSLTRRSNATNRARASSCRSCRSSSRPCSRPRSCSCSTGPDRWPVHRSTKCATRCNSACDRSRQAADSTSSDSAPASPSLFPESRAVRRGEPARRNARTSRTSRPTWEARRSSRRSSSC